MSGGRRPGPAAALRLTLALAAALALIGPAQGESLSPAQREAVLAEAQEAYDRGTALLPSDPAEARRRFERAAERFRLLVDDGVRNGRLYYNLANAHLQAGDLGRAVLNYRRAERFIAGDPRLESNLAYARTLCRTRIEPGGGRALTDALLAWHRRTPLGARFAVFGAAWVVLWIAVAGRRLRPGAGWRATAIAALLVALVFGGSVAAERWLEPARAGVILADDVVVRKGNGAGFAPRFAEPLQEGVEFTLRERRGDWLRIELADGRAGWIRAEEAALV